MGWLGPEGVGSISGARWSAGAVWADAADPQPSDHDWEDPDDWPVAYDPDGDLVLGVFVDGRDVTADARAVSWSLGQPDLWSDGLAVTSASITLRGILPDVAGRRVVILTEADVLWTGQVESQSLDEAPNQPAVTSLVCADDMARAAQQHVSMSVGGRLPSIVSSVLAAGGTYAEVRLAQAAGLNTPALTAQAVDADAASVIGEAAAASNASVAWSPSGVVIYPRTYRALGGDHEDVLRPAARASSTSRNVADVRNAWAIAGSAYRDEDSIRRYGERHFEADHSATWWAGLTLPEAYFAGAMRALADPPASTRHEISVKGAHTIAHRVLPLEVSFEDGIPYLVKLVSHAVTPEAWETTVEASVVEAPTTQLLAHAMATTGLREAWSWPEGAVWSGSQGRALLGGSVVGSIIPAETTVGGRSGQVSYNVPDAMNVGLRTWSWSLWFKDSLSNALDLLLFEHVGTIGDMLLSISTSGVITIAYGTAGVVWTSPSGAVSANAPHHLLLRRRTTSFSVEVNGSVVTPASSSAITDLGVLTYSGPVFDSDAGVQFPALFDRALPDGWAAAHHALATP